MRPERITTTRCESPMISAISDEMTITLLPEAASFWMNS